MRQTTLPLRQTSQPIKWRHLIGHMMIWHLLLVVCSKIILYYFAVYVSVTDRHKTATLPR